MKESKLIKLAQKEYNNFQHVLFLIHHDNKVEAKYQYLTLYDIIGIKKFYGFILKEHYKKAYNLLNRHCEEWILFVPEKLEKLLNEEI